MKRVLFLILFLLFQPVYADFFKQLGLDSDSDDSGGRFEKRIWSEAFTAIPELADKQNLIEFSAVASYPQYHYAIDEKSLSVGKRNGIVRFIIVISSSSGAKNSYYQGLNCSKKQIKTYAYAHSSAKIFTISSVSTWKDLSENGVMGYSKGLAAFYFCDFFDNVLPRKEILNNLKYGKETID